MLHGRSAERGRLARLVDDAEAGRAGALVLLGEPGVGKTALLDELAASAGGFRVLRTQGLESEAPLAFAALHRLLRPVQDVVGGLPAPQAHALRVAFGEDSGSAIEPFLVALATLSALTEAAESAPVLCLVDDAHWLDSASADALLFASRRLSDERLAVVFTARTASGGRFDPTGIDELQLGGLDESAAAAVVSERGGTALPPSVLKALLEQTGGNPLALVELPARLTGGQLSGTEPLPERLPLTDAVERSFLDRVRRLSSPAQRLLLVASADDSGSLRVVRAAARRLGTGAEAMTEAERTGLLVTDADAVRVAHPLVRSATYAAATGDERRAAHRALAAALAELGDSDRRAWHLAASVDGPDVDAADALTAAAVRAERRGGHAAAAAAFDRASRLAVDEASRARLLFDAARNLWLAGQAEAAGRAVSAARELADDRILRSDIDRLRGRLEVNVGSAAVAHRIFTQAARAVAAHDPERALEMSVAAFLLRVYDPETGRDSAMSAAVPRQARPDELAPREVTLRRMLEALAAEAEGRLPDALASLEAAVESSRHIPAEERPDDRTLWTSCAGSEPDIVANLGATAVHLGHDQAARDCYTQALADGRYSGAVTVVLYALPRLAFLQLASGEWEELLQGAREGVELATSIGQSPLAAGPLAWIALVAALRGDGDFEEHRRRAATAGDLHLGVLTQLVRDLQHWAAATVATNAGDHAGALHHHRTVRVPALRRLSAVERVAAAVRADDVATAQVELDELATYADASRLPWAQAAAEHGRALLAPAPRAADHFERALVHAASSGRIVDSARIQLAYGEALRRNGKRVEARVHLRSALTVFEQLNAEPLAARTAQELRASGETARRRDPSTETALTPMERQVAELVARGLSNKEVAAQCWISPRTVAFHLRNVFTKTGITSRSELAHRQLTHA